MHNLNLILFNEVTEHVGRWTHLDQMIAGFTVYAIYALIVFVIWYTLWYIPKQQIDIYARLRSFRVFGEIALAAVLTRVVVEILKVVVAYPRPFQALTDIHVLTTADGYSFPSGHAALSMALATSMYYFYPRVGKWLMVLAVLIGISRIYVGVHYPFDVGVGLLIGYLIPKLIHRIFSPR